MQESFSRLLRLYPCRKAFLGCYILAGKLVSAAYKQLCSSVMDDSKSGRRVRTISFAFSHGMRRRRRSEDSTNATIEEDKDSSNTKKLQEMLQQSLRREADTLKKLRHLSEMYQQLLYQSHSPSWESTTVDRGTCAFPTDAYLPACPQVVHRLPHETRSLVQIHPNQSAFIQTRPQQPV